MHCGHCRSTHLLPILDMGVSPPSNRLLKEELLDAPESFFPLGLFRCADCGLSQCTPAVRDQDLFDDDYPYFSSVSALWLAHAKRYTEEIVERLALGSASFVVEVAANDGYLLKNFVARSIPCLGVEPTPGPAAAARTLGVPVTEAFFSRTLAHNILAERGPADLIACNNVFAHVSNINDFAAGIHDLLHPDRGVLTIEFPHLLNLLVHTQFDTVYHEHFYYYSLKSVQAVLKTAGLRVFDVERTSTHGGSLRVFACRLGAGFTETAQVGSLLAEEFAMGLDTMAPYEAFAHKSRWLKNLFLQKILALRTAGKSVIGYGAAAKGNTLLNWAGIKPDLISVVLDNAASKQGRFMPGSRIPILSPRYLESHYPDVIVIFPWNIAAEIEQELKTRFQWSGEVVTLSALAQSSARLVV
jgi:hypothetical protein